MADTVIVTGAGDSVARIIAERLFADGADVHICDVNAAALADVLAANPGMTGTVTDVADSAAVGRLFADARERMGDVSVLINVVGVGGPRAAIEELTDADWRATMGANIDGMFYAVREAVPGMKRLGGGCIINFSSGSTRTGLPLRTPYVVSKYAVEGLTKNLARELGPANIRVNAVLPGIIDNPRMRAIIERNAVAEGVDAAQVLDRYLGYVSMRTMVSAAEVAAMVVHLVGPGGRHVSGQLIGVCGNVEWEC